MAKAPSSAQFNEKQIKKREDIKGTTYMGGRAAEPTMYVVPCMSSLFFIFFSLICALEGTFATMGPALHGTLAPEHQVQVVWGLEATREYDYDFLIDRNRIV